MSVRSASGFGALFLVVLITLSVGASQHHALSVIVGIVFMIRAGIGGFLARRKSQGQRTLSSLRSEDLP